MSERTTHAELHRRLRELGAVADAPLLRETDRLARRERSMVRGTRNRLAVIHAQRHQDGEDDHSVDQLG